MTRPPRARGDAPPLTAADLQRGFDKVGQQIQASEERTGDKLTRVEAKGDARQEINVKAQAEAAARMDALAEAQARADRRSEEILATSTRGYRTLEDAQREAKLTAEKQAQRLQVLEERAIPEVAQIAEGVKQSGREDRHRLAGLIAVGSGGTFLGICFWGSLNFIANHTKFVVTILHGIGFGLGKIPTPHE